MHDHRGVTIAEHWPLTIDLTSNRLGGFSPDSSLTEAGDPTGMGGESDDPEDAAARLEAALERIAQHTAAGPARAQPAEASAPGDVTADAAGPTPSVEEIAARLDSLIDRLRTALNASPGGRPG